MGSIQSGLHAIFDDERRAVTTPGTVVASVTARIGRRRAGKLVGASAGTLAVAGLAAALPFALSHGGTSNLGPAATPPTTNVMPENPLGLRCGDPIPSSLASDNREEIHVYTARIEVPEPPPTDPIAASIADPSPGGLLTITHSPHLGGVLARAGVVTGWADASSTSAPSTDTTTVVYALWACPAAQGDAAGGLAPGNYVLYDITQMATTP